MMKKKILWYFSTSGSGEPYKGNYLNNTNRCETKRWICCGSILSLVNILYFPLFWGMVMYGNEFETKENKI